ncbi:zinc ABC transporter substrate-binding protein ZnuA [Rhizobium sp. S-51]|uniref:High-affinity zinc uptake system protein ZnuA n=1 Tax=Rhizobium terricola TaxID=2728849 RepID=A0A7Y0FUU3_9HYPH|nr:zinc ABC transporter substrate-binding protein ZnuA [Rhizobium terricola]NML73753.1 zinc ABC transporter substrate-binding protein ZnuA [Rhizobium terricola]
MTPRRFGLAASTAALFLSPTLALAAPQVVVSIKPVHSLVAAIMQGVGDPSLIVEGAASPHTYSLKPSNARALENADVVFWVGPGLEAFLEKPLDALAGKAKVVELEDAPGLVRLPFREGGAFEAHDHGDEHAEGEDHAGHDEHAADEHAGEDHDHEHGGFDMHLWLDPMNAKAMAAQIEATLVAADPANAARYKANGAALAAEIDALDKEVASMVAPVLDKPFVVFHDAYQYFEKRYDVRVAGSITVSPETMPGAERIAEIHAKVKELKAACVFAEPQFEPKLISVVTEGTDAKSGVLDPEGGALDAGPALYPALMRNLAKSLADCLPR